MTDSNAKDLRDGHSDSIPARVLARVLLGFFGGVFLGPASYMIIWESHDPRLPTETPAVLMGMVGFLLGGIGVALGAFTRNRVVRVVVWAIGGAGFGNVLEAIVLGGLEVGTVLTLSGLVMGIVGSVIGYRRVLPNKDGSNHAVWDAGGGR